MVLWPHIATFTHNIPAHAPGLLLVRQNTSAMASAEQPFDDREYVCNYSKLLYNVAHVRPIELVDLSLGNS